MPDVIIPVLDAAGSLPGILGRMPGGFNPIVVDDGSTDGSAALAERLGARVIRRPRRGLGTAACVGLLESRAAVVCVMDADRSADPQDLNRVVLPILDEHADLVIGARHTVDAHAWPTRAQVAERLLALELRRRSGVRVRSIGPMHAARREPLLALRLASHYGGWPLELVTLAARAGWRIQQVDVSPGPLDATRTAATRSLRGSLHALRDLSGALA